MMKIPPDANLPAAKDGVSYLQQLTFAISRLWSGMAIQVNNMAEGRIEASYNSLAAPPTTGYFKQGDVIRNVAPVEAGTAGSRYVVTGWICVASGSPGTWRQQRVMTGN